MAKSTAFDKSKIEDIPKAIEAEFNRPEIAKTIVKGQTLLLRWKSWNCQYRSFNP